MYWNNPTIKVQYPSDQDPIQASSHAGAHCLFYDPAVPRHTIRYRQTLQDICTWANGYIQSSGATAFVNDQRNHYDIANIIKLNMWIADIKQQGIVKPWMMLDQGDGTYLAGTGDSRLRCLECIPEITHVPAFISTRQERAWLYAGLEQVQCFDRFAELCAAESGQEFLFRLTDVTAPYGIYWYEYNNERTRSITPSESWCVRTFANYAQQHSDLTITKDWFNQLKDWQTFAD
jgi:hypothetical protein